MKKNNEIQLTKNKMDLNHRKITNHPPSPEHREVKNVVAKFYLSHSSKLQMNINCNVLIR